MSFEYDMKKTFEKMEERKENRSYSHWNKTKNRFYPVNATHDSLPSAVSGHMMTCYET